MDEQWKPTRDDELHDDERLPFPLGVPERVKQENQQVIDKLLKPHRAARAFGDVLDNRKTVGDIEGIRYRLGPKKAALRRMGVICPHQPEPISSAARWPFGEDGLRNEAMSSLDALDERPVVAINVTVRLFEGDDDGPELRDLLRQPGCIDALVERIRHELLAELDEDGE